MPIPAAALKAEQKARGNALWDSTVGLNPDGTWDVECLLRKRKRAGKVEYLTRWRGWTGAFDSWERINDRDMIDEFEAEQELAAYEAAHQRPPRVPFSLALCDEESNELAEQRVADVEIFIVDIGDTMTKLIKRQLTPSAELLLYMSKPLAYRLVGEKRRKSRDRGVHLRLTLLGVVL